MLKYLFHIHTQFSFDSFLSPNSVVRYAASNGYSAVAITDHNTILGSLEAKRYVEIRNIDLGIIVGAEYSSELGDIIGLFLIQDVRSRSARDIVREIKDQRGMVVLPHPFKGHSLNSEFIESCDLIEAYNSRASASQNERASILASEYNKPVLAGNDAHCYGELGLAKVHFLDSGDDMKETVLYSKRRLETYPSQWYNDYASQLVKAYKTRSLSLLRDTTLNLANRSFQSMKSLSSIGSTKHTGTDSG